jgi:hypothetical protein
VSVGTQHRMFIRHNGYRLSPDAIITTTTTIIIIIIIIIIIDNYPVNCSCFCYFELNFCANKVSKMRSLNLGLKIKALNTT